MCSTKLPGLQLDQYLYLPLRKQSIDTKNSIMPGMLLSAVKCVPAVKLSEYLPVMDSMKSITIMSVSGFFGFDVLCVARPMPSFRVSRFLMDHLGWRRLSSTCWRDPGESAEVKPHRCCGNMEQLNPMLGFWRKRLALQRFELRQSFLSSALPFCMGLPGCFLVSPKHPENPCSR